LITTHLTAAQLEQLDALLADTTPGGGHYRPPVQRDIEVLRDLEHAGLSRFTVDCGYEITDAGRAVVIDRAMDAADTEAFLRYASNFELRESIRKLKAVVDEYADDPELRERTLRDIEACQDVLDSRTEGRSETSGRHRLVEVDDRPTETLPAVVEQTAFESSSGTLPGLPVVEPDYEVPDQESAERLLAAIKGADTGEDVYDELAAETTGQWQALQADLGDDRSWWRRTLRPHRVLILSVVAAVVITWGVAWLVMGR
jgi:hypothetical protein